MEQRAETGKKIAVLVLGIFIILGIAACVFLMLLTRTEKLDQAAMATSGVVEEQSTENLLRDDWIEESLNSFQVDAPADVVAALTVQTQDTVQTPEAVEEEYLCTYSSERLMTEADVAELQAGVYENLPEGKNIIQMVINEMYAKYGYQFQNEAIQSYFDQKEWYQQITVRNSDMEAILSGMTDIEVANVQFLAPYGEEE